jgi:flagellar hook-length control protein FliK
MGSALPDLQTIQDDVFVFAAGGAPEQPLRLLPLAQLEPLLPTDATDQASQVAAKVAAADGKPAVGTPATDSPAVSSPEASKEAAAAELTGKVVADQTTATSKAAASETFHFAAEAHGAKANAEKQAAANHKAAEEKLALQQQAQKQTQQSAQGAAQAAAPSTEAANKQAANAAPQAAAAAQQATPKQDRADSEQKSSEARPAPSAPAAAQAAAAPKAAAQPAPITWTPEIAAGYTDGGIAASETMAGGLTSLRGESSFMNAMSLMGGKTSPELAAHVAKQVNMQVTRAVNGGTNEFTMRLNPSELGGLKIKMAFTEAGKVSAQVMVERPETLELLQREVKGIERAIESGGHKMDSQGISFSLDTGDGESAGKAFAKAVQEDQHADKHDVNAEGDGSGFEEFDEPDDLTDLATLEEILSRVTPESGLDVRV